MIELHLTGHLGTWPSGKPEIGEWCHTENIPEGSTEELIKKVLDSDLEHFRYLLQVQDDSIKAWMKQVVGTKEKWKSMGFLKRLWYAITGRFPA